MAFNQNDNSFEKALATKMQLILDQPMSDISTGLVNNDYEGDFFKIGNTVSVVKPDPNSVNVSLGKAITPDGERQTFTLDAAGLSNNSVDDSANYASGVNDSRLKIRDLTFKKNELVIDKTAKYAFAVSDFTEAEGKWDYESAGLAQAAYRLRKKHNIETASMIVTDPTVIANQTAAGLDTVLGTAAAPIVINSADQLYEDIILEMYARLYDKGAITADGQIPAGSNPTQSKQEYGKIYMPTRIYTQLLKSKYFTDRSTADADGVVKTGTVKTITNLDVSIEPALVSVKAAGADDNHVTVDAAEAGTFVIVAGTKNAVTRASKVLAPDSFKSHERFATEYHGVELYGEKVFEPEALCIAFVKFPAVGG